MIWNDHDHVGPFAGGKVSHGARGARFFPQEFAIICNATMRFSTLNFASADCAML